MGPIRTHVKESLLIVLLLTHVETGIWFQPGFLNASCGNYQIITTTVHTTTIRRIREMLSCMHVAHVCVLSKPQQSSLWRGWSRWELSWPWNSFRWCDIHAKRSKSNCSYLTASWVQSMKPPNHATSPWFKCELFSIGTKQANLVWPTLVSLWLLFSQASE